MKLVMKIIAKSKRANFDYEFSKTFDAGIILQGHEVKSIKTNNINIIDAFARIEGKEIFLKNMDIPLYQKTAPNLAPDYQAKMSRKLLLNKTEIGKIAGLLDKPGNVLIPLSVFLNKRGLIKIKLGVGKRKRKVEKKQLLKEKDIKRQMDRDIKNY